MKRLILLDAYALIYRAFYALMQSPRINSKGFNTSTVFGFVNTLTEILNKLEPTHVGIAFDPKGPTFRHEAFPDYKAQREKTPEGISESVPIIKEIVRAFNIPIFEISGYEADDVIGTLAYQAEAAGFETYMVTPDKDYCQLVTERVRIYRPSHGRTEAEILGPQEVNAKYGLDNPLQVIDMLGLMGDASDNVPGCPGVGQKTAVSLIKTYGSIEGIYQNIQEVKGKLREKLENNQKQVIFSKFLVTIKRDAPIELHEEEIKRRDIDKEALRKIFEELEFRSLLKKLYGEEETTLSPKGSMQQLDLFASPTVAQGELFTEVSDAVGILNTEYEVVEGEESARKLHARLLTEKNVAIELATTSLNAIDAQLVGLAFSVDERRGWYFPMGKEGDVYRMLDIWRDIFESETIGKVGYNLKFSLQVLSRYGISLRGELFDVLLAHYVIQPEQRHQFEFLADCFLHCDSLTLVDYFGTRWHEVRNMADLPLQTAGDFSMQRADYCIRLKPLLEADLEKNNEQELFRTIEMPLMPVLARMEMAGVRIDTSVLLEISRLFANRLQTYEQQIFALSGRQFNISSPRQVGEILFDVMKLDPKAKRTKTGQYETSESVLEALRGRSPIIENLLNYRGLKKLLNTYVDALPALVHPCTGHIHTSFNQAVTATGRLSCSDPNLQNIPVRGEDGKEIRKAFIPEPDCLFFSADYSQIELRIMAHLANDEHMIKAFLEGQDIHAATAAKIFHKTLAEVNSDERRKAKTANFGIIYGITSFGLSQRIGMGRAEAKELIENYFESFPSIKDYIEKIIVTAQQQGFVETLFHRRRYLPDINSHNGQVRKFAERNAVNAPIQGSAADIIKLAMIPIDKRFREEKLHSKMILQVHDELNFSVVPEEKEIVEQIVTYEMSHACELRVPLLADCGWGQNWLESH